MAPDYRTTPLSSSSKLEYFQAAVLSAQAAYKDSPHCVGGTGGKELPELSFMLLQNALIHHHKNSRLTRPFCRALVDHRLLHPDRGDLKLNCLIHDLTHKLRTPKHIDDINFLGNVKKRRIRLLPQRTVNPGIHGNNFVSLRLHVGRDAVTGP